MTSIHSPSLQNTANEQTARVFNFPWTTTCIILINILMYVGTAVSSNNYFSLPVNSLIDTGANFSALTLDKDWWRLVTSVFLHGNLLHLLVNAYSLFIIGLTMEPVLGHFRFLGYYLLFGVSGSLASLLGNDFKVSVGASGAIFGMFGCYVIHLLFNSERPLKRNSAFRSVLPSLVINLIIGFTSPYIDNAAHIGGLLAGFLCAIVFAFFRDRYFSNRNIKNYLFILLVSSFSVLYCLVYRSISRDRVTYYHFFVNFINADEEATRLENGSFTEPLYRADLNTAYALWSDIHQQLHALEHPMNSSAVEDRQVLNTYIQLRKKKIDFLKKMISYGSFIFLDSASLIHSQIEQLPQLQYPLNFYPSTPDKDTLESKEIMFDNNWNITNEVADKVYTRKFKSDKIGRTQGWTYDYYSNGTIQMKGYYQNNILNGITSYYYPNGACHSVGIMLNGDKIGKWQYFYKSRTLQSEIQYDPGHPLKMLAFFDSTGKQLVFNGNGRIREYDETENLIHEGSYKNYFKDGIWNGYYPDGSPYYKEVYKDGDFIKGESFSSDSTRLKYERLAEYPEPVNGWEKYKHYTDSAVAACPKSPSTGVVSIELYIDSTGYIKSMKPIMMIGSHCEDTLMKIIKKGPPFHPGKIRGQLKAMRTYVFGFF